MNCRQISRFKNAIDSRNSRIDQIKLVCEKHMEEKRRSGGNSVITKAYNFANDFKKSKVNVVLLGRSNCGKSMLSSLLIGRIIDLPTICRKYSCSFFTRLIYSQSNIARIYRVNTSRVCLEQTSHGTFPYLYDYQEVMVSKKVHFKSNDELYCLYEETDIKLLKENCFFIFEIGIPCELLKAGIQLIDCPPLDDRETVSDRVIAMLRYLNTSIICYLFDHNAGLSMSEAALLDKINCALQYKNEDYGHCAQFILIENKVDLINRNEFDQDDLSLSTFQLSQAIQMIKKTCHFKKSNDGKLFKSDIDKLLPIQPLSTAALFLQENNNEEYLSMLFNVMNLLEEKISDQWRRVADIFSYYISNSEVEGYIDLWFGIKSLGVEDNLVGLLNSIDIDDDNENMIVKFGDGYKVWGLYYQGGPIQVTTVVDSESSDLREEMERIYRDHYNYSLKNFGTRNSILFVKPDNSVLFIVDKNMPHRRLMDTLSEFSLHDMESFIKQLIDDNGNIWNIKPNFRPDNVYLDNLGRLYCNRNIPNCPKLPFVLNERNEVEPFNLTPSIRSQYNWATPSYRAEGEFYCNFAWFVWILMEGSGNRTVDLAITKIEDRILLLQKGRFLTIPPYLKETMRTCWKIDKKNKFHDGIKIRNLILSNQWVRSQSLNIDPDIVDLINMECTKKNLIADFDNRYKIYAINSGGTDIQVTTIRKTCRRGISYTTENSYQEDKYRLFEENKNDTSFLIFENENQTVLHIIDEGIPNRRLLECLPKFDFKDIQQCIQQIGQDNQMLLRCVHNFRIDNLYVDKDNRVFYNERVPNNSSLHFILGNKALVQPFQVNPQFQREQRLSFNHKLVEFIYNFGWLVWLLLEGTGCKQPLMNEFDFYSMRFKELDYGRFPDYPQKYRQIMIYCWNVDDEHCFKCWERVQYLLALND